MWKVSPVVIPHCTKCIGGVVTTRSAVPTTGEADYFYKYLSYRRETALQGGLVLAKSVRLELGDNFADIVGLSSTIVT